MSRKSAWRKLARLKRRALEGASARWMKKRPKPAKKK
jgi:hypothetical protein